MPCRVLLLILALLLPVTGDAQAPLEGSIQMSDEEILARMPAEIYGTWRFVAVTTETNAPKDFGPHTNSAGVWRIQAVGDRVMLTNPAYAGTFAMAAKSVQADTRTVYFEFVGRSPFFSYMTPYTCREGLTLSLQQDRMNGRAVIDQCTPLGRRFPQLFKRSSPYAVRWLQAQRSDFAPQQP